MPRREIVTIPEMQMRRASAWERSYRLRTSAQSVLMHSHNIQTRIVDAIARHVPAPEMSIDGYLYRPLDVIKGEANAAAEIGIAPQDKEIMCRWYWTDQGWDEFVRLYQSLPDITEPYYWTHEAERDGAVLIPVSAKPYRADTRYNLGTTEVQVPDLYLNSG